MWAEISRLTSEDGLTILLTTHYLEEADRLAQQLAIVDKGRVVVTGSPEALKSELRGDAIHVELSKGISLDEVAPVLGSIEGVGGRSLWYEPRRRFQSQSHAP